MWSKIVREFKRLLPLFVICIVALALFGDYAQMAVQMYRLSMVALVIGAAHLIRKSMFPYLDLEGFIYEAKMSPVSASIVFLGMVVLLSVIIFVSVIPS